jgi:outer membrane protein
MKRIGLACAIGMMAAVAWAATGGAAGVKVAVLNMVEVIRAHPDTKEADDLLEKQLQEVETHQNELLQQQDRLKKEFEVAREEAGSKALSDEGRAVKIAAAEKKLAELSEFSQKIRKTIGDERKELADRKARMQRRIVGKIRDAVAEMAKKEGYTVVLDASAVSVNGVESLLYAEEKADITAVVIETVKLQAADAKPADKTDKAAAKPEAKPEGKADAMGERK